MGVIEVDLFSKDVDGASHPEAVAFRRVLESVAEDYGCTLLTFEVEQGVVCFSFDDDVLTAEILKVLRKGNPETRQSGGRKQREGRRRGR